MPANDAGCDSYAANYITLEKYLEEVLKELSSAKADKDSPKEFAGMKVGKDSYIEALSTEYCLIALDKRTKDLESHLNSLEAYCGHMLEVVTNILCNNTGTAYAYLKQAKVLLDKMPKKEGG